MSESPQNDKVLDFPELPSKAKTSDFMRALCLLRILFSFDADEVLTVLEYWLETDIISTEEYAYILVFCGVVH